jgi:hypothetical protein
MTSTGSQANTARVSPGDILPLFRFIPSGGGGWVKIQLLASVFLCCMDLLQILDTLYGPCLIFAVYWLDVEQHSNIRHVAENAVWALLTVIG